MHLHFADVHSYTAPDGTVYTCEHPPSWKAEQGGYLACPADRQLVREVVDEGIVEFLHLCVVDQLGLLTTNASELIGMSHKAVPRATHGDCRLLTLSLNVFLTTIGMYRNV